MSFFEQFLQFNAQADSWIDFGLGDYRKLISIKHSYGMMGDSICLALPFFHAFSGCDSTCSFYRKTKKNLFDHWMTYPEHEVLTLLLAFQQLSWQPLPTVIEAQFPVIEKFIDYSFGQNDQNSVDNARYIIFSSSPNSNLRELPPSQTALKEHVLRSAYQSGWIWGTTLSSQEVPPLTDMGWIYNENKMLQMHWFNEDVNSSSMKLMELIKTCKCKVKARCINFFCTFFARCINCNCGNKNILCWKYCNCKCKATCRNWWHVALFDSWLLI